MQVNYSDRNIKYGKGQSLKSTIKSLISYCNKSTQKVFKLHELSILLKFPRRRFYDVINVFSTIGFCERVKPSLILWKGRICVQETLFSILKNAGVYSANTNFSKSTIDDYCSSISKMTEFFFILLGLIGKKEINIKEASVYMGKDSNLTKTIIYKLYHITHILEAADIIKKNKKASSVYLTNDINLGILDFNDPLSINSLLSRPCASSFDEITQKRYKEYVKTVKTYASYKTKQDYDDAYI